MRSGLRIGVLVSIMSYVASTFIESTLTSPLPAESLVEGMLPCHLLKFAPFSIPTGVVGMLFDWYLLILPIPAVWTWRMSLSNKIVLIIIFMTGGL
jgi:hypothetical protein